MGLNGVSLRFGSLPHTNNLLRTTPFSGTQQGQNQSKPLLFLTLKIQLSCHQIQKPVMQRT